MAEDVELEPYQPTLMPTHIDVAIPEGTMLLVLPRSGNSLKKGFIIPNSPGLVDQDYRGHLAVLATWIPHPDLARKVGGKNIGTGPGAMPLTLPHSEHKLKLEKGTRVAQAVLVKYEEQEWVEVPELPPTSRGRSGFGSTGG